MRANPETIDARLPQTQCTQCGYPRCRAYAEAIADGKAGINQCPPGGEATIASLAQLLNLPPQPLNPVHGTPAPRVRVEIDEPHCIGCRKCIDVCPVDAIVGARKLMHTVIATDCSGCLLCLPVCPVDCLHTHPVAPAAGNDSLWREYPHADTDRWRTRTTARLERLRLRAAQRLARRIAVTDPAPATTDARERMRAEIRA
ncbi:MAG: RnfABCDGE type electron transport complex subunit B, partial [Gammaproteobacteria bacterium]|nr:RnfABCDGE type electron transport complex subunit B [Gammaproteobacteria bacterium]